MAPSILIVLSFLATIQSTISGALDDFLRSTGSDSSVRYGTSCTVSIESCTSLYKCGGLNKLVTNTTNEEEIQILLKHYCGKKDGVPYVCCDDYSGRISRKTSQDFQKCGVNIFTKNAITLTNFIAGKSKLAKLGAWPWMVALYTRSKKDGDAAYSCGGSLISDEWVLTAAHCVVPKDSEGELAYVVLGDLDLDERVTDKADPVERYIVEVIKHSKYRKMPLSNDIALLRLDKPVKYNKHIHPICLHKGERYLDDEKFYHNRKARIVGWGATGVGETESTPLLETEVPMVDVTECKTKYAMIHSVKIDEYTLCAGKGENDTCTGDSGGPLMFKDWATRIWSLGGIVSHGRGCGDKDYPGVYTRVAAFINWIEEKTNLKF